MTVRSVFVIAEAGSNWRMGRHTAISRWPRRLIDVAAEAGADAVKFQTYRAKNGLCRGSWDERISRSGRRGAIDQRHLRRPSRCRMR